jgi:hypothetical protein
MKDFTTSEVPAPLPIAGSSAVLLYSRRLRRRTLTASKQPPALHPSTGKVMSRPNNALGTSTSAPSITTAPSWGGRWCPGCPPLRSPKRSPRPSPAATAKQGPAARPGIARKSLSPPRTMGSRRRPAEGPPSPQNPSFELRIYPHFEGVPRALGRTCMATGQPGAPAGNACGDVPRRFQGLRLENRADDSLDRTHSVPRGRMIVEIVK